ncbi:uncharacterized protein LOC122624718 isoform X2 [Drosophila teissieri]|uniref:uncharacterized protein LOC122624718 isoform X2 n=1 Tax=Drosophila teissieri TaxID=7243 RepID=UPI001CB9E17E|nr:uncharacterized protein LOC122624718 isoform X2 [Drosophila teissieri]
MILERIQDIWYNYPVMVHFIIGPPPLPVLDFVPDHDLDLMALAEPDYYPPAFHHADLAEDWVDDGTPISDSEDTDSEDTDSEDSDSILDMGYNHPVLDFAPDHDHDHDHDMPFDGMGYYPPEGWLGYDTSISDSEDSDSEGSDSFHSWETDEEEDL